MSLLGISGISYSDILVKFQREIQKGFIDLSYCKKPKTGMESAIKKRVGNQFRKIKNYFICSQMLFFASTVCFSTRKIN
jgi:hypothetical protein